MRERYAKFLPGFYVARPERRFKDQKEGIQLKKFIIGFFAAFLISLISIGIYQFLSNQSKDTYRDSYFFIWGNDKKKIEP